MAADVIHVACQADERLAPDLAVMLHSLLSVNASERFEIHFLHDRSLAAATLQGWRGIVESQGSRWSPVMVPAADLQGFARVEHYGGHACWYRLFLHRLLPELPRVLYLDADTLVADELRPLWEMPLQGKVVGAVTNSLFDEMEARVQRTLGMPGRDAYFNSGVLLLDLAQLRATGLGERVIALVRAGATPLLWPDQDALNAVLWPHRLVLPPRWNATSALWELPARYLSWTPAQIAEARARPAIVHFVGPYKPLHYRNRHPWRARWFAHLRQTPWRDRAVTGRSLRHLLLRPLPVLWQWRIEGGALSPRRVLQRALPPGSALGALARRLRSALTRGRG
jgi:lipopolysaccharide biosynthesis glycosyltransferase